LKRKKKIFLRLNWYALFLFSKGMSILFPDTLEWSAKPHEIHFSRLHFMCYNFFWLLFKVYHTLLHLGYYTLLHGFLQTTLTTYNVLLLYKIGMTNGNHVDMHFSCLSVQNGRFYDLNQHCVHVTWWLLLHFSSTLCPCYLMATAAFFIQVTGCIRYHSSFLYLCCLYAMYTHM